MLNTSMAVRSRRFGAARGGRLLQGLRCAGGSGVSEPVPERIGSSRSKRPDTSDQLSRRPQKPPEERSARLSGGQNPLANYTSGRCANLANGGGILLAFVRTAPPRCGSRRWPIRRGLSRCCRGGPCGRPVRILQPAWSAAQCGSGGPGFRCAPHPDASPRQRRRAHQILVDRMGGLAAFADRPHHQGLAAAHVAG